MGKSALIQQKRIIDFDPTICGAQNGSILLFSPIPLIEDGVLYLPEKVRMPDGSVIENIELPWAFTRALELWEGKSVSMFASRQFLQPIFNRACELIDHWEMNLRLHLPKVINMFLYDDVIEEKLTNGKTVTCTSENGILYLDGKVEYVPDCNPYAKSLPLVPIHDSYKDSFSGIDSFSTEGCGRDLFGGIYSLDGKAFIRWDGNREVSEYHIRPGVEKISNKAFWVVTGLGNGDHGILIRHISLPDSLKYIGKEAFRACGLREMTLPDSVCEIDDKAFINCQVLESIKLPQNLQRLGESAFYSSGIKRIKIPKSVTSIGDKCFYNCWQLSAIEVEEGNAVYTSEDGVLFNHDKTVLLRVPPLLYPDSSQNENPRKDLHIIHEEEWICEKDCVATYNNLFENITYVTKFDPEKGIEYKEIIHKGDVYLSPALELSDGGGSHLSRGTRIYVENGEHIKSGRVIGLKYEYDYPDDWEAYYGPSRKEYTIPSSVITLADNALQRCPFKILNIPQGVISIGDNPFDMCSFLEMHVDPNNERFEAKEQLLIDKKRNAVITRFGNNKEQLIPSGYEVIEGGFFNISGKDIIIPEGVKFLGNRAFDYGIPNSIHLPKSLCYSEAQFNFRIYGSGYEEYKIVVPNGMLEKYRRLLGEYSWFVKRYMEEEKDETVPIKYHYDGKVSELDLAYAIADEHGALYSSDGKRLLKFTDEFYLGTSFYRVKDGTEVICEDANCPSINTIHLPPSLKYICRNAFWCERIVFEGDNIDIEDNTFELSSDTTIYIPCGTWANFYKNIEIGRWKDEDDEDIDEDDIRFNLIELSRPNVYKYLKEQKEIFLGILSQHQLISSYSIASLDGTYENRFICYKDNGKVLCFNEYYKCYYKHILHLSALGYKKRDITNLLGISIDDVKNNREALAQYLGRTLASHVIFYWIEEFVDEDSGEVISIDRNQIALQAGHTLVEEDINMMLENKGLVKEPIRFLHESYDHDYIPFISHFGSDDDDTWKLDEDFRNLLIQSMFPYKKPEDVSKEEKLTLAYNIVTIIKGVCDHGGYLEEILLPLKFNGRKADAIVEETEAKLRDLISTFYDDKINRIMACETDSQVVAEFKDDREIIDELTIYLEANGIKSQIVESYINHVFKFFTRDDDLW